MTHKIDENIRGCDLSCESDESGEITEAQFLKSRRHFMQRATTVMLGAMSLTLLPTSTIQSDDGSGDDSSSDTDDTPLYGFLVDTGKCIGSGKCLTACRIENNVPEGKARTWVERYVHFKDGSIQVDLVPETGYSGADVATIDTENVERAYFVPKLCNQCRNPPCNQVCPTHASFTSPEGIELIDT